MVRSSPPLKQSRSSSVLSTTDRVMASTAWEADN